MALVAAYRRITTMSLMASCLFLSRLPVATGLPIRVLSSRPGSSLVSCRHLASVTGTVYSSSDDNKDDPIIVKLFTKEGCTLCDKVKDVLVQVREEHPHTLQQVDITDDDQSEWFSKYKYDIPVLHINDQFWIKHRINVEEATKGLTEAKLGIFQERRGEPDAGAMERKQAERQLGKATSDSTP